MDGKNHLAAGVIFSGLGLMVMNTPLTEVAIPLIVGGISGLAPDLDHQNSIFIKRVRIVTYLILSVSILAFFSFILYKLYITNAIENNFLIVISSVSIIIATILITLIGRLKTKSSLLIGGLLLIVIGLVVTSVSISLLGIYFASASLLKHRGLTHSLHYLVFWSFICFYIEKETGFRFIWLSGTLGYLSHLITDNWFSKRKIKWIKTREITWLVKKIKTLNFNTR